MSRSHRTLTRVAVSAALLAALLVVPAVAHGKARAVVSGGLLTVTGGDGADQVAVVCSAQGQVKVNGKNPRTGAVACAHVSEVDALTGAGNDRVNLSGVGADTGFGQRELAGFGHGTGAAGDLGTGNDRYIGGASAFNLVLAGPGDDNVTGGRIRDQLQGGSGRDRIAAGAGRDLLLGNSGSDKLIGGIDDDQIFGNGGDDLLLGGAGADLLGGGPGRDRLFGGPGPDHLTGGPGKDQLKGGPGNNTVAQD